MDKVCYTAIIGNYEELKEPSIVSKDWRYICFTDQPITSNIWEIIQVVPTMEPRRMARYIKIMFHKFIDAEFSIWLDASFTINIDLNIWWSKTFKPPFSAAKHPLRDDVFREIDSCIANKRGEPELLQAQKAAYEKEQMPRFKGIITSGLLMRQRTNGMEALAEAWWAELERHSSRDQVAFAKVSRNFNYHTFVWDYSMSREIRYTKHYNQR